MAERTIIIDGFSKSFAMTGWRLGYAVAPKHVIDAMDLLVLNTFTCVAEFTQVAAIEALRDSTNAVDAMVAEYRKRRDLFVARLNRIPGFRCQIPDGSFYAWVNVEDTGLPAEEVARVLLEEAGVAGIAGAAFGAGEKLSAFFAGQRPSLARRSFRAHRTRLNSLARRGRTLVLRSAKKVRTYQRNYPRGNFRMRHLIHFAFSMSLLLAIAPFSHAQAKPVASPADIAKIYDRLLPQIDKIAIYDNHSHATFPDDSDMDAQAAPSRRKQRHAPARRQSRIRRRRQIPFRLSLQRFLRRTRQMAHRQKKAAEASGNTAYWDSILDKLNIETCLANRVALAPYLDPQRFHWVFFVDSFLFPFDNRDQTGKKR